jgi:uncharacterized protein YndB with AHSA1/START domain
MITKNEPVVKEIIVNASASKVWKAITDKNEMKKWYFDLEEFKPEVGFEFRFMGGPDKENQYLHICEITEVVTNKKLTYSWRYDSYPGKSFVTFELIEEGNDTRVKLTHTELETFGTENPHFAKENFIAGWEAIIGTSLKNYFEN